MSTLKKFLRQLFQLQDKTGPSSQTKAVGDSYLENRVFEIAAEHGISPDAVLNMASLAAEEYNEKVAQWHTLTPREQQVAVLICVGQTNREIARQLNISISTVKTHVRHVLHKFELNSKDQLWQYFEGWDFSHFLGS